VVQLCFWVVAMALTIDMGRGHGSSRET